MLVQAILVTILIIQLLWRSNANTNDTGKRFFQSLKANDFCHYFKHLSPLFQTFYTKNNLQQIFTPVRLSKTIAFRSYSISCDHFEIFWTLQSSFVITNFLLKLQSYANFICRTSLTTIKFIPLISLGSHQLIPMIFPLRSPL